MKTYTINLSPQDYVELTGIYLANVRDDLADCGDQENNELIRKAINLINTNLVIKEVHNG
tara:strand:+ start:433 stop:612 length:180 start_codon:yes stop_codon:yes gene_type:complete